MRNHIHSISTVKTFSLRIILYFPFVPLSVLPHFPFYDCGTDTLHLESDRTGPERVEVGTRKQRRVVQTDRV